MSGSEICLRLPRLVFAVHMLSGTVGPVQHFNRTAPTTSPAFDDAQVWCSQGATSNWSGSHSYFFNLRLSHDMSGYYIDVVKAIVNNPCGNGSYVGMVYIYHLFMAIWGMVYYYLWPALLVLLWLAITHGGTQAAWKSSPWLSDIWCMSGYIEHLFWTPQISWQWQ